MKLTASFRCGRAITHLRQFDTIYCFHPIQNAIEVHIQPSKIGIGIILVEILGLVIIQPYLNRFPVIHYGIKISISIQVSLRFEIVIQHPTTSVRPIDVVPGNSILKCPISIAQHHPFVARAISYSR